MTCACVQGKVPITRGKDEIVGHSNRQRRVVTDVVEDFEAQLDSHIEDLNSSPAMTEMDKQIQMLKQAKADIANMVHQKND